MQNPLVSIITPCYNGEKFVQRFLESVLYQSYPNIELIFVNDGSTDKTEEIVLSYKENFSNRNINLIYIYQKNSGVSAALNRGLEIFSGKYLTWPDSDDILLKDNIKLKVEFLENNIAYNMVQGKIQVVSEGDLGTVLGIERRNHNNSDLFMDLVMENDVIFVGGAYMITKEAFLKTHKDRRIFPSIAGQNWQMLLPIAYFYRCGYIDEIVYTYIIRKDSHSRRESNFEDLIQKNRNHREILLSVIREINMNNIDYYERIIENKYYIRNFNLALHFKNKNLINELYGILKKERLISRKDLCRYFCRKYAMLYSIYVLIKRLHYIVDNLFLKLDLHQSRHKINNKI